MNDADRPPRALGPEGAPEQEGWAARSLVQKFGDGSTAFRDHPKEILDWRVEGAQFYLTPFEQQKRKP